MATTNSGMLMLEVALRIKSLRLDCGYSIEQMAELTGFSLAECELYENGNADRIFCRFGNYFYFDRAFGARDHTHSQEQEDGTEDP